MKYMNYQSFCAFILGAVLLLTGTNCITDITLMNCPAQYNLTHANLTVNASESLIEFFFAGMDSDDKATVETIVVTGDYDLLD